MFLETKYLDYELCAIIYINIAISQHFILSKLNFEIAIIPSVKLVLTVYKSSSYILCMDWYVKAFLLFLKERKRIITSIMSECTYHEATRRNRKN